MNQVSCKENLSVLEAHIADLENKLSQVEQERDAAINTGNRNSILENLREGFAIGEPIFDEHSNPVDFRFLEINQEFVNQSGLSREIINQPISQVLPDLESFWTETYCKVALTGKSVRFEHYNRDTERHYEVSCFCPQRGQFAILFRNITEQVKIEAEVRSIALFPEENPSPVFRINQSGILTFANRASDNLLGKWKTSIESKVPEFVLEEVSTALNQNAIREMQTSFGEHIFSFMLVPIIERGYVNFYGRDITEQKRAEKELILSEERLRHAQEIAHLGSWALNLNDNQLIWSDEVYRIFGLQPQEIEPSYQLFLDLIHPEDRNAVDEVYTTSLQEGLCRYEIEHRIVRKSTGAIRYVHEKCEHFRDENGQAYQSVGMVHDITEMKIREAEIQRLNKDLNSRANELEDANRELEAFNFSVAHDLRKPLTLISNYSQVINSVIGQDLDETCSGYLQEIIDGTLQMGGMIDALLNFSRLSHAAIEPIHVELSELAETTAAELQLAEPQRNVVIRIDPGIAVRGDRQLLQVVMNNLLGNAWKYTHASEMPKIHFGTTLISDEVVYFVRDNGCGFDMSKAEELFIPFRRVGRSENVNGFGVGLATVDRIIRRHGGRIWAESEPNQGATFFFSLPTDIEKPPALKIS